MKKRAVFLNTEAHRPAFNDFADRMRAVESREGWRASEVLRHWLDAGYRAIHGRFLAGEPFETNEREYMRIVGLCRKPSETMADLSVMLGACGRALVTEPIDFIGPIFTELSSDAGMGQFFTPHHVSYFMAKMVLGERKEEPYVLCNEPACGVGGMVLAAALAFRESGRCPAREMHWHMTDIDFRAFCGAYIQASLADVSAVVRCANSLSPEPARIVAATPAAILFPKLPKPPGAAGPAEPLQLTLL